MNFIQVFKPLVFVYRVHSFLPLLQLNQCQYPIILALYVLGGLYRQVALPMLAAELNQETQLDRGLFLFDELNDGVPVSEFRVDLQFEHQLVFLREVREVDEAVELGGLLGSGEEGLLGVEAD